MSCDKHVPQWLQSLFEKKKNVTAWWPGMHVSSEEAAWSLFLLSLTVNVNLVIHTDLFLAKKKKNLTFWFL